MKRWNFEFSASALSAIAKILAYPPVKQIRANTNLLIVEHPCDSDFSTRMKNVFSSKFIEEHQDSIGIWHVMLDIESIKKMYDIAVNFNFEITDEANHLMQKTLQKVKANIEASHAQDSDFQVNRLGGELHPFQRAGVAYAVRAKRTFIADEMGLGKTVEALATLEASHAFPALIVCPASLKLNWKKEAEKNVPPTSWLLFI